MKYLIVLFKNKERKKIIKKFKTLDRAKKFYESKINDDGIYFDKKVENGKNCNSHSQQVRFMQKVIAELRRENALLTYMLSIR